MLTFLLGATIITLMWLLEAWSLFVYKYLYPVNEN
jgi:hypothetical protein